ncbi:MAG: DUF131 domain-containing protein [archaeon YNP-LCB-024-027]|nr:DUF131 domain-containing protein [Candidatus Culexarchaeum yellowstonense]
MMLELYYAGIILIMLGILIMVIGMILTILRGNGGEVEGGGVVLIGPIPIVIGTSSRIIKAMIIVTVIMMICVIAFTILWARTW